MVIILLDLKGFFIVSINFGKSLDRPYGSLWQ